MREDDFFEVFVAEVLLSQTLATLEEIQAGIVGGGGDGGLDGVYIYLDGVPLQSTDDLPPSVPHQPTIELLLIQAKNQSTFGEDPLRKIEVTTSDLFTLDTNLDKFRKLYSSALLEAADRFRKTYEHCMTAFPRLMVRCVYASKGDTSSIHPAVRERGEFLRRNLEKRFPDAQGEVEFAGAAELLSYARKGGDATLQLPLAETAISTDKGGYVALVDLDKYARFLVDDRGELRSDLFDYNVRDYEGRDVRVNRAIRATLGRESGVDDDFWWLNNGVSIVAENVTLAGKTLNLRAPRIVNGLQTSMEVHSYFGRMAEDNSLDNRKILVRVVQPPDEECRDRIIKATNSQNLVPNIALRSADAVHLNIEEFFAQHKLWYERRQNKYKNEGKAPNEIVTIPSLAEAVLAVVFCEPHLGKPRLGGRFLLREAETYPKVFDESYDLRAFLHSIKLVHEVERYLDGLSRSERSDYSKLTYVAASTLAATLTGSWPPGPSGVVSIDMGDLNPARIDPLFQALTKELETLQADLQITQRDSPELRRALLEKVKARVAPE